MHVRIVLWIVTSALLGTCAASRDGAYCDTLELVGVSWYSMPLAHYTPERILELRTSTMRFDTTVRSSSVCEGLSTYRGKIGSLSAQRHPSTKLVLLQCSPTSGCDTLSFGIASPPAMVYNDQVFPVDTALLWRVVDLLGDPAYAREVRRVTLICLGLPDIDEAK